MSLSRIVILDDDDEMRSLIADQIKSQEFYVDQAASFPSALLKLATPDCILLLMDSKIPEIATSEVLKKIREKYAREKLAVLILAPGTLSEQDREAWKTLGADDFLIKPFERGALLTKVKTLVRKVLPSAERSEEKPGQISLGELTLDLQSFDVFFKGERLHLTPNEFKLLQALLSHVGEVLSRERLIELVQGYGIAVIDRAVDTHIFSLRKKLGTFGDLIETVRGSGYRISPV